MLLDALHQLNTVKDNRSSIIDNITDSSNISKLFKDKYEKLYKEFDKELVDEGLIISLIGKKFDVTLIVLIQIM